MLDPNPKPTEEEKIIYALSGFCIPPNVKKAIKQSLDYISAQRQAWEREKAGLEYLVEHEKRRADNIHGRRIAELEERVKIIEQDRDSWRRCAERLEKEKTEPKLTINIEESAIKELFKNQAEELTRLKAKVAELEAEKATLIASKLVVPTHPEETFDKVLDVAKENNRLKAEKNPTVDGIPWYDFLSRVQKENESLKAENERLRSEAGYHGAKETIDSLKELLNAQTSVIKKFEDESIRLSASLAAAREALDKIHKMPESSGCGDEQRIAQEALSDPSGSLAFERWKKMEAVVEVAKAVMSWWDLNPEGTPMVKFREALESLDAKGASDV